MLTTLRIKNLALVDDLTLDLHPGYTAITGETGAGKSILIGALELVLGERAERTLIRAGCESCTVEAVFDVTGLARNVPALLEENGIEACENGQLLIKRVFTASGANRQFINGTPATLSVLARLGEWLVDIHGPHDHQSLLHTTRQLDILDAFADTRADRANFHNLCKERTALMEARAALVVDEKTYAEQVDLLRFQVREIAEADFRPEEESELSVAYARASNAARLAVLAQDCMSALDEGDHAALPALARAGRALMELSRVDAGAASLLELHRQAVQTLNELRSDLGRYVEAVETDPATLQRLEDRLNLLQRLKRKYGSSVKAILEHKTKAQDNLHRLESRGAELDRLAKEVQRVEIALKHAAARLSAKRQKALPDLVRTVEKELAGLGFRQSRFQAQLTTLSARSSNDMPLPAVLAPTGFDSVEFLFAPNPGEPPRPLRTIASSGELARVMLGLKTALADHDEIPVLVFDEVDANIGGETATAVGERMRRIGRRHQVLCVTHLAPVAAQAETHLVVTKETKEGRTLTRVTTLSDEARHHELARMLGGPREPALRHARALRRTNSESRPGST